MAIGVEIGRLGAWNRKNAFGRAFAKFARQVYEGTANRSYSAWRNGEARVLRKLSKFSVNTIFDVGANLGDYTDLALSYFPEVKVHCFELIPEVCEQLQRRYANTPNIRLNAFGLAEADKEVMAHSYGPTGGTGTLLDGIRLGGQLVEAHVRRGASYMDEQGIEHVDLLKIDVEGAENLVLEGFRPALDAGKIDILQFEYGRANISSHYLLIDFYAFLKSCGYVVGKIYPTFVEFRDYMFEDEDFVGPNFLAVRAEKTAIIEAFS